MNARMIKENAMATTIYFTYDHIGKKIDGTEENFRMSGIPGSAQDVALMACLKEHPDYDFRIVKLKKEKNSYKGLKRELIHDYIDCFGTNEMMAKFVEMKKDGKAFGTIKSWFLEQFPNFGTVEKAKRKIQKHRLSEVKSKYKVKVKETSKEDANSEKNSETSGQ